MTAKHIFLLLVVCLGAETGCLAKAVVALGTSNGFVNLKVDSGINIGLNSPLATASAVIGVGPLATASAVIGVGPLATASAVIGSQGLLANIKTNDSVLGGIDINVGVGSVESSKEEGP